MGGSMVYADDRLKEYMTSRAEGFYYHYTTAEAAFTHILPYDQLRLNSTYAMNDPLENQAWAIVPVGGYKNGGQGSGGSRWSERVKNSIKILSFTVDREGEPNSIYARGFARARMWEQYGDRHRGVCFVFDRQRVQQRIYELGVLGQEWWQGPVTYRDELNPHLTIESGSLEDHVSQYRDYFIFSKLTDWQSEQEYRFARVAPEEAYAYFPIHTVCSAVILGQRLPDWQVPGIVEKCDPRGIHVFGMSWGDGPRLGATAWSERGD